MTLFGNGPPLEFVPRGKRGVVTRCQWCGDALPEGSRRHRRFCGPNCRSLAARDRKTRIVTEITIEEALEIVELLKRYDTSAADAVKRLFESGIRRDHA